VRLALTASSQADFLDVDTGLARLLELALPQAPDDSIKARLLARLAHELLGDSSAAPRRRELGAPTAGHSRRKDGAGITPLKDAGRAHAT
jgi:hypothetical protein